MHHTQQKKYNSLYKKHLNALKRQGKSASTVDSYARAVRRITEYYDCCPDKLTTDQIKDHFSNLLNSYSWSQVKSDRYGLKFFFHHVLERRCDWDNIVKPPVEKKLPDILSFEEISRMIDSAREPRFQCYILTVFSMGLRLTEALNLTIGAIDSDRMLVHVRLGKGRKDRMVIMPQCALSALRSYWATHRHPSLLFPAGADSMQQFRATRPMGGQSVQRAIKAIANACQIHKNINTHTLRHCYATHLLAEGLNLRAIQELLGHDSPVTTALYTQLTEPAQQNTVAIINAMLGHLSLKPNNEV